MKFVCIIFLVTVCVLTFSLFLLKNVFITEKSTPNCRFNLSDEKLILCRKINQTSEYFICDNANSRLNANSKGFSSNKSKIEVYDNVKLTNYSSTNSYQANGQNNYETIFRIFKNIFKESNKLFETKKYDITYKKNKNIDKDKIKLNDEESDKNIATTLSKQVNTDISNKNEFENLIMNFMTSLMELEHNSTIFSDDKEKINKEIYNILKDLNIGNDNSDINENLYSFLYNFQEKHGNQILIEELLKKINKLRDLKQLNNIQNSMKYNYIIQHYIKYCVSKNKLENLDNKEIENKNMINIHHLFSKKMCKNLILRLICEVNQDKNIKDTQNQEDLVFMENEIAYLISSEDKTISSKQILKYLKNHMLNEKFEFIFYFFTKYEENLKKHSPGSIERGDLILLKLENLRKFMINIKIRDIYVRDDLFIYTDSSYYQNLLSNELKKYTNNIVEGLLDKYNDINSSGDSYFLNFYYFNVDLKLVIIFHVINFDHPFQGIQNEQIFKKMSDSFFSEVEGYYQMLDFEDNEYFDFFFLYDHFKVFFLNQLQNFNVQYTLKNEIKNEVYVCDNCSIPLKNLHIFIFYKKKHSFITENAVIFEVDGVSFSY